MMRLIRSAARNLLGKFLRLPKPFWLSFAAACVFVAAAETAFESLIATESAPGITQSIFNFSGFYQKIVVAPRDPIPRFTSVIEIDPEKDVRAVGLNSICEQRAMMAKLVCRVAAASPRVIVIDKYFLPRACESGDSDLRRAIADVTGAIPIVIGRRIMSEGYLMPAMTFPPSKRLTEGAVNVDPDTRRLPLAWQTYGSKEEAERRAAPRTIRTLALAAAVAYEGDPRLVRSVAAGVHPYISFLGEREFPRLSVAETFENGPPSPGAGRFCPDERPTEALRKLAGRVVLIGEINRDLDEHPTVAGRMSGLYLQANFIEALIDGRYYTPAPLLDYVFGFCIAAAVQLVLLVHHDWKTVLILLAIAIGLVAAAIYLIIVLLHWYVNPALIGATGLALNLLHLAFGKAERLAKAHAGNGD